MKRREFLLGAGAGAGLVSAWAATHAAAQGTARARHVGYVSVRRDNRVAIFTMGSGQRQAHVPGAGATGRWP